MRGFVFYDGPSVLDGAPIVGIAVLESSNVKTGNMVQTYILRADLSPIEALQTGDDASICGECLHRPANNGTCYVEVGKSVQNVFYAFTRGAYTLISPSDGSQFLAGRVVRLGTYGDPAAIPAHIWRALISQSAGHTGYSHQWRAKSAQSLRDLVMASADCAADRDVARTMGWRTFRIRLKTEALGERELICPASDEAGFKRQCITCLACDGAARGRNKASIAIIIHGAKARRFSTADV